ncbi:MAG TPA: poly(A) polymerase, partial [Chloroflexi bacterium]|nr:poly(A) polymerase [Chloroflexota bacterium]
EAACLLSAWFEAHERLVDPPLLLNGREVMDLLGVAQGPMVGRLLDALREAQVTGDVSTRQEAERFLRAIARYD